MLHQEGKWLYWAIALIASVTIAVAIFIVFYVLPGNKDAKRECERVGGKMQVVDTIIGKTPINIYGCVK
jgi:hypothetical protein